MAHRLTDGRIGWCYAGTALEASDFPEPIAKSQAAPLTAERNLKKQDPWQVGPVETRLANPTESALGMSYILMVCEIDNRDESRGTISI